MAAARGDESPKLCSGTGTPVSIASTRSRSRAEEQQEPQFCVRACDGPLSCGGSVLGIGLV